MTHAPLQEVEAPARRSARFASVCRAVALFIGGFCALNLVAQVRHPGFDANRWWLDTRLLPAGVGVGLLGWLTIALIGWAIWPRCGRLRLGVSCAALLIAALIGGWNAIDFYRLRSAGVIATPVPIPFSLGVVGTLVAIVFTIRRCARQADSPRLHFGWAGAAMLFCAGGFPLAQIVCYGWTDYRRPADAIVVFGARAYANGQPSDALADRALTAIELYQRGLAPRLIVSGGPGDGAQSEAEVMKRMAMRRGVPEASIIVDPIGLSTDATVRNAKQIVGGGSLLVVSHGWHLPRAKLRFERAGMTAYTVPADERGQPLRQTPYLVAREVAALWVYYLRAVGG